MEFKDAEKLINASLVYGNPPLLVVGDNGIGKTEMLRAFQDAFEKNTVITSSLDYGGLKDKIPKLDEEVQTIVVTDLQNILGRKLAVRKSTLAFISQLICDVTDTDMSFTGDLETAYRRMNFIIGCTPAQLNQLIRYKYHDFLDRFMIIPVERVVPENKKFELEVKLVKKVSKKRLNLAKLTQKTIKISSNARENQQFNDLFFAYTLIGYDTPILGVTKVNFTVRKERLIGSFRTFDIVPNNSNIVLEKEPQHIASLTKDSRDAACDSV